MRYTDLPITDLSVVGVLAWVGLVACALWGLFLYARRRLGLGVVMASAIGVRILVWGAHVAGIPLPDDSMDAMAFERTAWRLAIDGRGAPIYDAYGFSWILSFIYEATGRVPPLLQLFNIVLGSAAVVLAAAAARHVGDARAVVVTAWIVALFPTLVLYSVVLMREAIVLATFLAVILLALRYLESGGIPAAVAAAFMAFVPAWLQVGFRYIGPAIGAAVMVAAVWNKCGRWKWLLFCGMLALVLIGTYLALGASASDGGDDVVSVAQDARTRGRAAYPDWMVLDSVLDVPWLLPIRVLMLLFAPFPWMVENLLDFMGLVDAVLYGILVVAVGGKIVRGRDVPAFALVLFVAAVGIAIFAMGTSNYGTGVRHRAKFLSLLALLATPQLLLWWDDLLKLWHSASRRAGSHRPPG